MNFDPDKMTIRYEHPTSTDGRRFTKCTIEDEHGVPIACGVAICSKKDSFNKERGRLISSGRAIKALETGRKKLTYAGNLAYCSRPIEEEK